MHDKTVDDLTGMHEVIEAVDEALATADPAKREALARTLDAYAEDFPDEFCWATSGQAPALLHHLLITIDVACRASPRAKSRGGARTIDSKPEGNA